MGRWALMGFKTARATDHYTAIINTVIGTLAVDGWAVTFGTVRRGLPINSQCTNFILFDVAL